MGQPPELMRCDKRNLTLTRAGCARLWESTLVKRPEPYEGRHACLACPIGAANAGKPQAPTAVALEELRLICPRCTKPAQRLIQDWLCISCYNRHREALKGKNAKGGRPLLCGRLHTERFTASDGAGTRYVRRDMVTGSAELILLVAKKAKTHVAFGALPIASWRSPQGVLPL